MRTFAGILILLIFAGCRHAPPAEESSAEQTAGQAGVTLTRE